MVHLKYADFLKQKIQEQLTVGYVPHQRKEDFPVRTVCA